MSTRPLGRPAKVSLPAVGTPLVLLPLLSLLVLAGTGCVHRPWRPSYDPDRVAYVGAQIRQYQASQPATQPASRPAAPRPAPRPLVREPISPAAPLELSLDEAVLTALENNRDLAVQRLNPKIRRTFELEELAVFDPLLSASLSTSRTKAERLARAGAGIEHSIVDNIIGTGSLSKFFPTGTTLALENTNTYTDSSLANDTFVSSRLGLTATQALLNGFGTRVNLASLQQARLDTLTSQYELRGFAEALVAEIETTYWDHVLAERQIAIFTDSLKLANQQLEETSERIRIGKLGQTELAAAKAEVALRQEALINVRSNLASIRLRLLRLLNPQDTWARTLVLTNQPKPPGDELEEVEQHVKVALKMRPEMNQARLAIERDELELVKTRNGLLPRLDVFLTLGKTGYADTFGEAVQNLRGDTYDVVAGARFSYALGNREARARHGRATISKLQAQEALQNLAQLVELDVRTAAIEVQRSAEQIPATAATRQLQEETLRAETEKFRVGKSTSLLVARAQRDLVAAQIAEIQARVNYVKEVVRFWRLEGSLLVRRGVTAPGAKPFEPPGNPKRP